MSASRVVSRDSVSASTAAAWSSDNAPMAGIAPPSTSFALASAGASDARISATTASTFAVAKHNPSTMWSRAAARRSLWAARRRTQSKRKPSQRSSA